MTGLPTIDVPPRGDEGRGEGGFFRAGMSERGLAPGRVPWRESAGVRGVSLKRESPRACFPRASWCELKARGGVAPATEGEAGEGPTSHCNSLVGCMSRWVCMRLLRGQGPGVVAWVLESFGWELRNLRPSSQPTLGLRGPICTLGWAAGSVRVLRVSELGMVTLGLPGIGWGQAAGYRPHSEISDLLTFAFGEWVETIIKQISNRMSDTGNLYSNQPGRRNT